MNQNEKANGFVTFGLIGIGQIIFGAITVVVQRKIADRITEQEIEKHKPKAIRGFQATPML